MIDMYKRKTYKGVCVDTYEVFVCDGISDISSLPTDPNVGSTAFVIEDSSTWMINSSGQWVKLEADREEDNSINLSTLTVSENGTVNAPSGTAYNKVITNVTGGVPANPADGKTHIWIRIANDTPAARREFPLTWSQTVSRGVTVDWGDGSSAQTFTGTGSGTHSHTYASGGEYEITLNVTSGKISFEGEDGTGGTAIYGPKSTEYVYNRERIERIAFGNGLSGIGDYAAQYCNIMKYVSIPTYLTRISDGAFNNCLSLVDISMPDSVTSIGANAFYYCYALEHVHLSPQTTSIGEYAFYNCYALHDIEIPSGVTQISQYAFHGCYGLASVAIPSSVTSIGAVAFASCFGLTSMTIPASVTSIGANAFAKCYGIKEYHMKRTTPPTLSGSNAFSGIASDCVIYVPYSSNHSVLNAYKSATNWATYASIMQEEAQS